MKIPQLQFTDFATGDAAFHAVRATFPDDGQAEVRVHSHDFYEWIVVLNGQARHLINGSDARLQHGQLVLIRPQDQHGIIPVLPGGIEFVNVAFSCGLWEDSVRATGLEAIARDWNNADTALCLELTPDQRQSLRTEAMAAVHHYHNSPTRLAFSQFWRAAAGALSARGDYAGSDEPLWLRNALMWARSVDLDDLSLETLVQCSGVSLGHFSRTLKAYSGVTPTEFINEIRIRRAAYELAATDKDLVAIAFDCGFENLSYFYRRFKQFHGKTPRHYREQARRSLPI